MPWYLKLYEKMTDQLIPPEDYTPDILNCIQYLKYRMDLTRTDYEEADIGVFRFGDEVYILANPVLGEEAIYDDFGQVKELLPMRNLTTIFPQDWMVREGNTLKIKSVRVRILRPDLCMKIVKGKVVDGGDPPPLPAPSPALTTEFMVQ